MLETESLVQNNIKALSNIADVLDVDVSTLLGAVVFGANKSTKKNVE